SRAQKIKLLGESLLLPDKLLLLSLKRGDLVGPIGDHDAQQELGSKDRGKTDHGNRSVCRARTSRAGPPGCGLQGRRRNRSKRNLRTDDGARIRHGRAHATLRTRSAARRRTGVERGFETFSSSEPSSAPLTRRLNSGLCSGNSMGSPAGAVERDLA